MGFQGDCRGAAIAFVNAYIDSQTLKMQVYPARPRTLMPPTAFVDAIRETLDHTTLLTARNVSVDLIVVYGLFDSADAATRKDDFVDGLIAWSDVNYHQAGANTLIAVDETEDLPEYVPTWLPLDQQRTYYASRIVLGGFRRGAP